jgi:opacity protein-like surface antigen
MNNQKNLFIILAVLLFFTLNDKSLPQHKGEISFISGYQMLGTVDVYAGIVNGEFDINDAAFFSGALGFRIRPEVLLEIQYLYQPTQASFDPYGAVQEFVVSNVDVHYIMAGAMYERPFSRTATGYGGLSIGTAGLVPDRDYESEWRFAFGLTLGAKFMVSKNIGIKLQAQGLFPVQWAGGSFYLGTGGAGYGLNAGTSIAQINVGGGLFYAF